MKLLVGRTPERLISDRRAYRADVEVAFDDDEPRDLLSTLESPFWKAAKSVTFGPSMGELHPVSVGGIASIVSRIARGAVIDTTRRCEELADWMMSGLGVLTPHQRRGLVCSGAYKAQVLARVPAPRRERLLEIGPGPGLMAWLLAQREWRELREVVFVEPQPKFSDVGKALWATAKPNRQCITARAEKAAWDGSFDIILCCGSLLLVDPASRDRIFQRFRDSLAPGGVLLVMERVRLPVRPPNDRMWERCFTLENLLELLSIIGTPQLYHPQNQFLRPLRPTDVKVADLRFTCVFAARRT